MYVRVVTPKKINIAQLRTETGFASLWDSPTASGETEVHGMVDKEANLLQAISAHVARDILEVPTPQEQLDALTALLVSKGTLSQAEIAATKAPRPRPTKP